MTMTVEEAEAPTPAAAESPFLPGTRIQYAWDSTSLGWLKTCPRLYQYNMIEGWRPKGDRVHLTFGIHYHAALELYDRLRLADIDHEEALCQVVGKLLYSTWDWDSGRPWTTDHPAKTREHLIRTVVWYLDQFQDDPAKTVVLETGKPAVELSFQMQLDYGPGDLPGDPNYIICGHLDRVVEFAGGLYVMDRKSTSYTITNRFWEQWSPDNQMSLYAMAAQVIYKIEITGVIIDAAQVAVEFSRFERGFTFRTPRQIEEWLQDLRYWLRQSVEFAVQGRWPMNDKACHLYGGCVFRKVCSKDPEVRHLFLAGEFEREGWNPLEPR